MNSRKTQAGYFDISAADIIFFMVIIALLGGFFFYKVLPFLWSLIKPFIHSVTA